MSENITPSKKIHSLDDARKLAKKRLPKMFFDFVIKLGMELNKDCRLIFKLSKAPALTSPSSCNLLISFGFTRFKKSLIDFKYDEVIATTTDSSESQIYLSEKITGNNENYPDLIANISLRVPDDLCIIQSTGKQKLLAASVCSPSYWNLKEKIGKSLREVHKPVK